MQVLQYIHVHNSHNYMKCIIIIICHENNRHLAIHNKMLLSHAMKVLAQFIDASSAPLSPCELTLHSLSTTTLCTSNSSHLHTDRETESESEIHELRPKGLNEYLNHHSHDKLSQFIHWYRYPKMPLEILLVIYISCTGRHKYKVHGVVVTNDSMGQCYCSWKDAHYSYWMDSSWFNVHVLLWESRWMSVSKDAHCSYITVPQ